MNTDELIQDLLETISGRWVGEGISAQYIDWDAAREIVDDALPVIWEFAGICAHCHHRIPDHDGYGRCCATVECTCHREGDE